MSVLCFSAKLARAFRFYDQLLLYSLNCWIAQSCKMELRIKFVSFISCYNVTYVKDIMEVSDIGHFDLQHKSRLVLPPTKQRWVCAAARVPGPPGMLVCGDRGGTVHVYDLLSQVSRLMDPLIILHGYTGIRRFLGCL